MKKVTAGILAVFMLLALAACGGGSSAEAGIYKVQSAEMFGDEMSVEEVFGSGENQLELKNGGKATFILGGESTSADWKLDGGNLTVTVEGMDFTGTLKDGVIELDFMGVNLVMAKDGAKVPASGGDSAAEPEQKPDGEGTEEPATEGGDSTTAVSGKYNCIGSELNGQKLDPAGEYYNFESDTRGTNCFVGKEQPFTWSMDGDKIHIKEENSGLEYDLTMEDGVLTLDNGMIYRFAK